MLTLFIRYIRICLLYKFWLASKTTRCVECLGMHLDVHVAFRGIKGISEERKAHWRRSLISWCLANELRDCTRIEFFIPSKTAEKMSPCNKFTAVNVFIC